MRKPVDMPRRQADDLEQLQHPAPDFVLRDALNAQRQAHNLFHRLPGIQGREQVLENNLDRKSTRLNSSHVKSSYAVFCLKKNQQDLAGPPPRALLERAMRSAPAR